MTLEITRERLVEVMRWSGCDHSRLLKIANRLKDDEIGDTHIFGDNPVRIVQCAVEQLRLAYAREMRDGDAVKNYLSEAKAEMKADLEKAEWLPSNLMTEEGAKKEAALFKGGIEDPF